MLDLVPVHGGLESPVSRTVLSRRKQFLAEAASPRIEVNRADLSTLYRIADGTLPDGVHGRVVARRSGQQLDRVQLPSLCLTAPIALPSLMTSPQAAACHSAAVAHEGEIIVIMRVSGVFAWDKPKHVEKFYGTAR
jgi:ATP sulfurylase